MQRSGQSSLAFGFLTVAVVCLILHGSLYPYDFRSPLGQGYPIATLLSTWDVPPTSSGDLLANLFLYIPFGFSAAFTFPRKISVWTVTLAGFVLCTTVEILQFYDAGRVTNASDVYLNTTGTLIGAVAAKKLEGRLLKPSERLNLVPCMLLAALVGYKLFPYVPTIDLHKYWHSLRPIIEHPAPDLLGVFHYFGLWLAADCLVATAIRWEGPPWLPVVVFAAFIFGGKIVIVDQVISSSEIVGAGSAFLLWLAIRGRVWMPKIAALVLCAVVIAQRLSPFNFVNHSADFGWLPFQGFLRGSLSTNVQSMFEKSFLYGSLIWFAALAGVRLPVATAAVAAMLFAASVAETYLPGRSGEITDAILAVAMGLVIFALQAASKAVPNPSPKAVGARPQ